MTVFNFGQNPKLEMASNIYRMVVVFIQVVFYLSVFLWVLYKMWMAHNYEFRRVWGALQAQLALCLIMMIRTFSAIEKIMEKVGQDADVCSHDGTWP